MSDGGGRSHSTPLAVVFVAQEKVPSRRDRLRIPFHMNFNSVCASNGERGQRLLDKHCRDLTAGISEITHAKDIDGYLLRRQKCFSQK